MPQRRIPYAQIVVALKDLEPKDQKFLKEWARELNIPVGKLLKRIMLAAVVGQLYAEKMPKKKL